MSDTRTLTLALGGVFRGSYGSAPCPVCQPERRRDQRGLSITENGGKLLLHCFKRGCDFRDIAAAAGITPGTFARPDPETIAKAEAERRAEAAKREAQARAIWAETLPIGGTIAEAYLRGRGITCALPYTLRFHPECWHAPTAKRHPAMVAMIEGAAGAGIHRTYLRPDGTGKAFVTPDRMMLGQATGGAVRLSGASAPLAVCEGIETGLSLPSGLLGEPATVWAALSTSNLRGLHLPRQPGRLIIAADGDKAGHDAAETLAERAYRAGWRVWLQPAPEGQDWNDVLQARGVAA